MKTNMRFDCYCVGNNIHASLVTMVTNVTFVES
jgi:hypothetical protein